MKRLDNELLVGKQCAVLEARALHRMLGPEHTVEELRDLIAVAPNRFFPEGVWALVTESFE